MHTLDIREFLQYRFSIIRWTLNSNWVERRNRAGIAKALFFSLSSLQNRANIFGRKIILLTISWKTYRYVNAFSSFHEQPWCVPLWKSQFPRNSELLVTMICHSRPYLPSSRTTLSWRQHHAHPCAIFLSVRFSFFSQALFIREF